MLPLTLSLAHVIQKPGVNAESPPPLLLLLHSLGSNETQLMSLATQFDKRFFVIGARAPIPIRSHSYAWFHVNFTPTGLVINTQEAEDSRQVLLKFIDEIIEAYGVDSKLIYLIGFSQGAIMSLSLALTQPERIAGVVAMSGLILPQVQPSSNLQALAELPIFMAHGMTDPVLSISYGQASRDRLQALSIALTYREYPMGHQFSLESLKDIDNWLTEQVNRLGSKNLLRTNT